MAIHGLALSGGGAKGAFEAGAAAAIIEFYQNSDAPITMLSGASVGSLNAVAIAQGGPKFPMEVWWDLSNEKIYKSATALLLWRIWRQGALYDSSPLKRLIDSIVDTKKVANSQYRLFVHTTDQSTSRSVIFTGKHPDLKTGVYASASIPGAFPPVRWRGHWLVDGGVVDNSPIRTLINAGCDKITCIHLDDETPKAPIFASEVERIPETPMPHIRETVSRSIETMMGAHFQRDLRSVHLVNDLVEGNCAAEHHRPISLQLFSPAQDLGGSLDFNTKRIRIDIDRGYHQCIRWLNGSKA